MPSQNPLNAKENRSHVAHLVHDQGTLCPLVEDILSSEGLVAEGFDILILGKRQNHHCQYAQEVDRCVIVDDGGAASQSLFEVLSGVHPKVMRVRWREDGTWKAAVDVSWLTGARRVAVVGGILVPQWAPNAVAAYLDAVSHYVFPGTVGLRDTTPQGPLSHSDILSSRMTGCQITRPSYPFSLLTAHPWRPGDRPYAAEAVLAQELERKECQRRPGNSSLKG